MNKPSNNSVDSKQLIFLSVGTIVGVGALTLPNDLVKKSGQDAWIAAILGAVFPLYLGTLWLFVAKKYPDKNILDLSKLCFGKIIGTFLNFLLFLMFLYRTTSVASALCNIFIVSLANYQTQLKLLIIFLLIGSITAYMDLRILGRLNTLIFYITIILSTILVFAFKEGNYRNLLPVFQTSPVNIIKSTKESLFAYNGIEIIFIASPFLVEKDKLAGCIYKTIFIVSAIYFWFVFITIYFLGIDLIPKYVWSVSTVPKAVVIPVVSNFRLIFMMFWSVIIFKTLSNFYFLSASTLKDIFKKVNKKIIFIVIFILSLYLSLQYKDEITRRSINSRLAVIDAIFSVAYTTVIAFICHFKKGANNES